MFETFQFAGGGGRTTDSFFFYFVTEGQSRVERPTHTHSVDDIRQRDGKSLIELLLLLLASMMDNGARDSLVISVSCVCNRARRGGFQLPNMQIIFPVAATDDRVSRSPL